MVLTPPSPTKSFRSLWSPWKMDYSNFCLECVPLMIQIIGLSFKFIQSISSRSQLPETIQQFSGFVYRPEFRPDLDSNFSFQRFNFCHYKLCHVIHMISEGIDSTTTVRCWYTVWWKTKWRLRIFSIPHFFLSRIKSLIVFSIFEQILNSNSSDLSFVKIRTCPQFWQNQRK